MIGRTIGQYRVVGQVGRGGMGTVYRAIDETLDRDVAIKILNPELADTEIMKRFRAEATAGAGRVPHGQGALGAGARAPWTGYMIGTPAYMPPEQVLGHQLDGRADFYSVGVMLYRLLTGSQTVGILVQIPNTPDVCRRADSQPHSVPFYLSSGAPRGTKDVPPPSCRGARRVE